MAKSYQQTITFRNKREQVVEEFTFDGGLVTDVHETKLKPNQSPNVANVVYNTTGSILTRDGYLRYNGNPVGASSDQANTGASAGTVEIAATSEYIAQTFQPSGAVSVTQIDLYLAMQTSGEEQYVQVQLWSTSSGAPSALLTDGTAQIKLITGTAETVYSFRFRKPIALSAATTYAVVLKPFVRGSAQTVNDVLAHRTGAAYANGQIYTSTDTGINWTAAGNDLKFVVYSGGNTAGTGLIRFYGDNGIQQTFAKFGATYYRGNDSTGAMTTISMNNGVTPAAANFIDYTVSNGTLLLVDDSNYILKYRGSTNAAYSTGTITATNGSATVTGSGTSWLTATNAEVGEYIQLPDDKWYKITAINTNTSLTVEIAYYGSTLAGESYVISPWGVVQGRFNDGASSPASEAIASLIRPQPTYIENHLNRIWTLDGNTLRFSCLDTSISGEHFNNWDTSNNAGTIIIPSGEGDSGTGLKSLNGYLYIFQKHAIWELVGNSPSNFELRNISNEVGLLSKRTLVEWDRYLLFYSGKDVYLFDGVNLKNLSDGIVGSIIRAWANGTSPAAVLWDNKYIVSYTESGGTANSSALFYDLIRGVWGRMTNVYANTWSVWDGGTDDGRILFVSSNQGSIYRWDSGTHDDGYEIETVWDTPSLGFGSGIHDKTLKRFYLQQVARGDWNMNVTLLTNVSEEETSGQAINLSGGDTALWDVAQWDVDDWSGEGALVTSRVAEFQGQGKYFKFRFDQTGYSEGVEIIGMNGTARVRRLT